MLALKIIALLAAGLARAGGQPFFFRQDSFEIAKGAFRQV